MLYKVKSDEKMTAQYMTIKMKATCTLTNRPFYSCLLGDLAIEWQRGWRQPCFDTDLSAFVV